MNKKILSRLIFGASLMLLAACSQDEVTDPDALPEGKYPLQIASVTMNVESSSEPWSANTPQTRVIESEDGQYSTWQTGDLIKVIVSGNGNDMETTCTLDESGNITAYSPQQYWKNTQNSNINAWYSNITEQATVTSNTVSLADQSGGLAYVLKADPLTDQNYKSGIALTFKHQLAKVRVYLRGTANEGNATGVTMNNCPVSCTVVDGEVTAGTTGTIAMHPTIANGQPCFEANVPAGTLSKEKAFTVTLGGGTSVPVSLNNDLTTEAAKVHIVTLKLHKSGTTEIDFSTGDCTINGDGTYYFTGSASHSIKVTGGSPNIKLEDASINVGSGNGIDITGGNPTITFNNVNVEAATAINITATPATPTLVFEGTNTLTSTGDGKGAISLSNDANVNIRGGGALSLGASTFDECGCNGWKEGAVLGSAGGQKCGNIFISDVTLNISNEADQNSTTAAIGSGKNGSSCGDISITDATINILNWKGGAGVGTSAAIYSTGTSSCGDIKIKNSDVNIEYGNYAAMQGAAIGCGGYYLIDNQATIVKGIYITLQPDQSKDDFLGKLKCKSGTNSSDPVGQGASDSKKGGTITNGIHWYESDGSVIE